MTRRAQVRDSLEQKQVFTTGEAAELCNVSQQTIIRCFDNGRLNGFRVPGSRFRRIPREDLIVFMKDNGMSLDALAASVPSILLIDVEPAKTAQVAQFVEAHQRAEFSVAHDAFEAGIALERCQPDIVAIGPGVEGLDPTAVRRRLSECRSTAARVIVFLGPGEPGQSRHLTSHGIDACVLGELDAAPILNELRGLLRS